jgi:3-phenylpropionate/trans-cinnamate dioxygenase ferredoxin reductase component
MKHFTYLIVGSGMTADAAVRGIRELDPEGSIGMIGMETDLPYARPPLSKGMWKGRPFEKIWRGTDRLNVEFFLGRRATDLKPATKVLTDDQGQEFTYDKLLLATGASPIHVPFAEGDIIYYRTLQDYLHLRQLTEHSQHFLVIGAGFIGTEMAAALTMLGKKVSMVFLEKSIGANIYPSDLSKYLNDFYRSKGVDLVAADAVSGLAKTGGQFLVETKGGRSLKVDGVVAGLGVRPNVELGSSAGLAVGNGIIVDDHLITSAADVFAAGDVALFPHSTLGKSIRVEHEDNALMMGKQAGRNMAGAQEPYSHTPMFYSDMFELGYEAVGELSTKLEMVLDWQEPFQQGVIYYLDGGRVRGVLLWNIWEKVDAARALMAEPGPFTANDLRGRIKG